MRERIVARACGDERFAQTVKQACLDHFIVLSEKHLRYLIAEFVAYYHAERPHLGTGNLPPLMTKPPDDAECLGPNDVVVRERLGGPLKHYERKAA